MQKTLVAVATALERIERQFSEYRNEQENRMSELILRAGRLEKRLAAIAAEEEEGRPVTDEEAQVLGANFWVVLLTAGKRQEHEVKIVDANKNMLSGTVFYDVARVDGSTQGPAIRRVAAHLYRTKKEAEAAPRSAAGSSSAPSSTRHSAVKITTKSRAVTLPPQAPDDE